MQNHWLTVDAAEPNEPNQGPHLLTGEEKMSELLPFRLPEGTLIAAVRT